MTGNDNNSSQRYDTSEDKEILLNTPGCRSNSNYPPEKLSWMAAIPDYDPNPILRINREGQILYANPAAMEILKNGTSVKKNLHLPENLLTLIKHAIAQQPDEKIKIWINQQPLTITVKPVPGTGDLILYGRYEANDHSLELQSALSLINLLKKRICIINPKLSIQYVNPLFLETIKRIPLLRIKENHLIEFNQSLDQKYKKFQDQKKLKKIKAGQIKIKTKSNKQLYFNLFFYKLNVHSGQKGTLILLQKTVQSRANIKKKASYYQKIIKNRQKQIEQSGNLMLLGRLTSSLIHDLRNPLSGISMALELLSLTIREQPLDLQSIDESCHKILEYLNRINQMINRISQFKKSNLPNQLNQCQVNTKIINIISLLKYKLRNDNIVFQLDLDKKNSIININPYQFEQIISILVMNAKEAFSNKQLSRKIKISTVFRKNDCLLVIKDNGTGIKKSLLKKIYLPFFSTKKEPLQTGMSLFMVKEILKKIGGKIIISSRENESTTVKLLLPIQR